MSSIGTATDEVDQTFTAAGCAPRSVHNRTHSTPPIWDHGPASHVIEPTRLLCHARAFFAIACALYRDPGQEPASADRARSNT